MENLLFFQLRQGRQAMEIVEIGKLLDVCKEGWKGEQFDMEAEAESKTTHTFL